MVRLGTLLRRSRDKAEEKPENEGPVKPVFDGPPIMVMIPDVAGVSSFRVSTFPHAEAAVQYVTSLSRQQRERAHAFWALQSAPDGALDGEDTAGEAMVLIRSSEGSDLVYVVSFLDIESAQSFARFEVKRGMHLGLILVYWASMVNVVLNDDGVQLIPEFPPRIDKGRQQPAKTVDIRPRHTDPADAPATAESAPIQPATNGRDTAEAIPPPGEAPDQRRIEAEAEEKRRVEAEAEARLRIEAEAEERRRRLDAAEEDQRLEAEAEDQRRIEAEAEEQRRVEAEAEEQRRVEAEAEGQRRVDAEAEEQRRIEAGAEEQRRVEAEAEEQRRIEAEAEEQRRIEAGAEEQRRVEAAAEEKRRIEAEAEEQRRIEAEAEEQRRIEAEAEEQRRVEAEAEEQRRVEAEAEEQRGIEEQRQREAEEARQRLEDDAERWRLEAEAEEQRRIEAEAEMRRLREAMEAEQRRAAEEAEDQAAIAAEAERLRFEAERKAIFERNANDAVASADDFAASEKEQTGPFTRTPLGNPIEELLREADWRVRVPNEYAKEPVETPPVPDPEELDAEAEEIADEVGKILNKRRWARRESPFDGFKSPPGRF